MTVSPLVSDGVIAVRQFNRKSFDVQSLIRVDVMYIKALPSTLTQERLVEASRRIRQASKLSRNALRSVGFFFLFVSGCFVLLDELYKVWPAFHLRLASPWLGILTLGGVGS